MKGMRADAKKAIDDLKPYRGGNAALWQLHELNNIDKHKFLLTGGADVLCEAAFINAPNPDHPYYWLKSGDPNFAGLFVDDSPNPSQPLTPDAGVSRVNAMVPTLHHLVIVVERVAEEFRAYLA